MGHHLTTKTLLRFFKLLGAERSGQLEFICSDMWKPYLRVIARQFNSGMVEGLNNRIKLTIRKAYGYCQLKVAEIALHHALGHLPEPEVTHRFC